MYDSAFITQFPTLCKNTQERHVSGHKTWEIGSVLEGKKELEVEEGSLAGKEPVRRGMVCLTLHILPRKRCLINWAIQTHNYIKFLNNRHFLPEVLLPTVTPSPLNPECSNETVLRSNLADNVALFFFSFFCFTFFFPTSHSANSAKSNV